MDTNSKEINGLNFREELFFKIINLSRDIWENKVDEPKLNAWLGNFEQSEEMKDCERAHAMYLLSNFTFFGVKEIRELLKSAYRDKLRYPLMQKIRKINNDTKNINIVERDFRHELNLTRFVGVGNPSESGPHLLYYFRQENGLDKDLFIDTHRILKFSRQGPREEKIVDIYLSNPNLKRYVFLDDLCGSGDQVIQYAKDVSREIKEIDPTIELYYITLVATKRGIDKVKSSSIFDVVETIFELDDSYRCFSENSRFFPTNLDLPVNKKIAERISKKYGTGFYGPDCCHGHDDGQLLLGFSHNTPDNTLPIFWHDSPEWNPIFKRHTKL